MKPRLKLRALGKPKLRIYCAWNNKIDDVWWDLGCPGSMRDLKRHAGRLRSGMRVMLYEPDELETVGIIQFDRVSKRWAAKPDFSTIRYLGKSLKYFRAQRAGQ